MDLLLRNIRWNTGMQLVSGDVRIRKGMIVEIAKNLPSKSKEMVGDFHDNFLYPGLINAHDHLEMNLYPKLGSPPYGNYVEWAKDIYHPAQSPLREIEKINIESRLLWGGLKNLIAGATTVIHHNPWRRLLKKRQFPVKVPKISWAHSLAFEKAPSKKFPLLEGAPFVIHAGEGTDQFAFSEVATLDKLGLLKQNTVLIHAIALNDQSIKAITNNHTAVVWCPASNFFMFRKTSPIQKLKKRISVALGSDSTLTGSPTLLHEMQVAQETNLVDAKEIFEMVTRIPAQIFNLPSPLISPGQPADLFIAPVKHEDYFKNVLEIHPADLSLVLTGGIPRLKNVEAEERWPTLKNTLKIQGELKFCEINVSSLIKDIERKVSTEILEKNVLWNLIEI